MCSSVELGRRRHKSCGGEIETGLKHEVSSTGPDRQQRRQRATANSKRQAAARQWMAKCNEEKWRLQQFVDFSVIRGTL